MKVVFWLIIAFVTSNISLAQNAQRRQHVDENQTFSIQNNDHYSDSFKFYLDKGIENYKEEEFDSAFYFLNLAEYFAKDRLKDPNLQLDVSVKMAVIFAEQGLISQALKKVNNAELLLENVDSARLALNYYSNKAKFYLKLRDYKSAIETQKQLKNLAIEQKEDYYLKESFLIKATAIRYTSDSGAVTFYLKKTLNVLNRINDKQGLFYCYKQFCQYHLSKNQIDSASIYYDKLNEEFSHKQKNNAVYLGVKLEYFGKKGLFDTIPRIISQSKRLLNKDSFSTNDANIFHILSNGYKLLGEKDSVVYYKDLENEILYNNLIEEQKQVIRYQQDIISFNEVKNELQNEKNKRIQLQLKERLNHYSLLVVGLIGLILLIFVIWLWGRFNAKKEIETKLRSLILKRTEKIRGVELDLKKQGEELVKARNEINDLVYSVAHDLRAPITNLYGITDLLKDELASGLENGYLQMQESVLAKIDANISNVINFSYNKNLPLKTSGFNLKALLDEIISLIPRVMSTGVKIIKEIDDIDVITDKVRLRIIIENLLGNACKFSFQKMGENAEVKISIKKNDNILNINISDNGPGIEPEIVNDIFTMFFKGSIKKSGSGLGLYVVKETVDSLNGKISVVTNRKEGAEFRVEIPLK